MEMMKAFTLWGPYGTLILQGDKTIETRGYPFPKSLIGKRVAIHEGLTTDLDMLNCGLWSNDKAVHQAMSKISQHRGKVIATAILACRHQVIDREEVIGSGGYAFYAQTRGQECAHRLRTTVKVDAFGDFSVGRWLWFLKHIKPVYPPVPVRGKQGFWNWKVTP